MYNENNQNYKNEEIYVGEEVIDTATGDLQKTKKYKNSGFGKKATKLIAGSLVFGLVAGVAFQGVNFTADYFSGKNVKQTETTGTNTNYTNTNDTKNEIATVTTSNIKTNDKNVVSQVVANVMPSIVSINCTAIASEEFYGRIYQQPVEGSGSGIIIGQNNNELLIVTNNHVVEGDEAKVSVVFGQEEDTQESVEATIKGTDSSKDLAVLSIKLSDLSEEMRGQIRIATLGDSEQVEVGEMAIAIGNALGFGQSVTVGYVSAKNREVSIEDATMTLIQTDAAINPGNSGGALLNANGEVIGINSAKYTSTDVEGIGYAIPISDAIPVITELMNREELAESEQGYLGIVPKVITDAYVERFHMPKGIYIVEVTEGSPADIAGLTQGMVITKVNNKAVEKMEDLQDILTYTKAGTEVKVTIMELESGEYVEKELKVTLGNKPEQN